MRSWMDVLKDNEVVKDSIKLLELEQDYLLLSLNEVILNKDEAEKSKLIESLCGIRTELDKLLARKEALRKEYGSIKSTTKPRMV